MIKRNVYFLYLTVLCVSYKLSAQESLLYREAPEKSLLYTEAPVPKQAATKTPHLNKVEWRLAAFYPTSDRFRDIYGNKGLSMQLEAARAFQGLPILEIWENLEWISMDSGDRGTCGHTDIDILNLSLGLKSIGKVFYDFLFLYAGLGADLGFVFIKNEIPCQDNKPKKHKNGIGVGGIFKSGAIINLAPYVYINLFADYLYLPVEVNRTVDVGGLKLGGGIGAHF